MRSCSDKVESINVELVSLSEPVPAAADDDDDMTPRYGSSPLRREKREKRVEPAPPKTIRHRLLNR